MGEYSYDPRTYEERYRKIYESSAEFWEEPVATEAFVDFIQEFNLLEGSRAVDMGCGEGRDSIFLAKMEFNVTAIDASRSTIERAMKWAKMKAHHRLSGSGRCISSDKGCSLRFVD